MLTAFVPQAALRREATAETDRTALPRPAMTVPPLLFSHRLVTVSCAPRDRFWSPRVPACSALLLLVGLICSFAVGCGSSLKREATEQLLASDAIDRSVSSIDFRELAGKKVYFDTSYIKAIKGVGFVNADYIISAMRQQMVAARCLLQDKKDDAEYIVEGRVGVLGIDGNEVTYGIPSSSGLSTAASLMPTAPPLPIIPELSFAKKNDQRGAARVGFFAYHRETGEPVWQSGISDARSTAKDSWVLGAGPFQSGTIYSGTQFAGAKLKLPLVDGESAVIRAPVPYSEEYHFSRQDEPEVESPPTVTPGAIVQASSSEPATEDKAAASPTESAPRAEDATPEKTEGKAEEPAGAAAPAAAGDSEAPAEGEKAAATEEKAEESGSASAASARADAVLEAWEKARNQQQEAAPLFSAEENQLEDLQWTVLPAGPPVPEEQLDPRAPALLLPGKSTPLLLEQRGSRTILRSPGEE